MSKPTDFVEFATNHLKSIKSKYTLASLELVSSVINILIGSGKKISCKDIIYTTPPTLLTQYGYLWNIVLSKANIETWEDFGNAIFICVDLGIFKKSEEDKLQDFIDAEKKLPLKKDCFFLEDEGYITTNIRNKNKNVY